MKLSRRFWRGTSAVFGAVNLGGAVFAAAQLEPMHAAVHVSLAFVAGVLVWLLAPVSPGSDAPRGIAGDDAVQYLQQSVDALALEVERIGETQRYQAKLDAERARSRGSDPGT